MSVLRIQSAHFLGLFLTAALSFAVACEDTEDDPADAGEPGGAGGSEAGAGGKAGAAGKAGQAGGKAGAGGTGNGAAGSGGKAGGAAGSDDSDGGFADDDAGSANLPDAFKISFSTTECFGFCPVYSVSLDQTGQVKFDGKNNTDQKGAAEKKVSAAAAAEVYEALVASGYFELNDKYATEADGCERVRTDSPTHNWSVEHDGETKALSHYLGCEGVEALDKLDEVHVLLVRKAEIQLWIAAVN